MKTTTPFYKIASPTTKQIFDAIIANEYTPLEKIQPKAKQIKVLLLDYYSANEILVTFTGVTNTGGVPIFLTSSDSLHEIASEQDEEFYNLSEEDQENEIELLGSYLRTYDSIFNL
jgi:phosphopentomutase